jgi:hypothetical protein
LAPRIKNPEGTFDMHFKVPLDKYKAYMVILHDEGKTQTEDLGEFVHRVEQKRIEKNPVSTKPISANVSCLRYTPQPVQQITDSIEEIENPKGIPILSSNQEIIDYVDSQEMRSVLELDGRLKVWNTQTKNKVLELKQAFAFKNRQRARA